MGENLRILVTGGTGVFGRKAVALLLAGGHEVRVFTRRTAPILPPRAIPFRGDLSRGEGVGTAVEGAEAILHAASNTGPGLGRGDVEGTRHLLEAAKGAGVRHLLYVSIVGIDRIPLSYYRRKLACERRIAESGIPYTILRATQFHELLAGGLRKVERWPLAPLPLSWKFQPVAAEEVASRAVDLLERAVPGRAPDFGGPEVLTLREMVAVWRSVRGRGPRAMPLPMFGTVAKGFREGGNTCPERADGRRTWAEFVRATTA